MGINSHNLDRDRIGFVTAPPFSRCADANRGSKERRTLAPPEKQREAIPDLSADEFRRLGTALVEEIAGFLETLPERPVTRAHSPSGSAPPSMRESVIE